jgi:hypothetical protein
MIFIGFFLLYLRCTVRNRTLSYFKKPLHYCKGFLLYLHINNFKNE